MNIAKSLGLNNTDRVTKKYCDTNFTKIGKGTSRHVYDIGNGYALKLAIGEKGRQQNICEKDASQFYNHICAEVYDYPWKHDNPESIDFHWIIVEKADRLAKAQDFRDNGFSLNELSEYCRELYDMFVTYKACKTREVEEERIFAELYSLCGDLATMPGDFARKSSWGMFKGELKLIDSGCSQSVYKEFYLKNSKLR